MSFLRALRWPLRAAFLVHVCFVPLTLRDWSAHAAGLGQHCGGPKQIECAKGLFCDLRPARPEDCVKAGMEDSRLPDVCVIVAAPGTCPVLSKPVCGCNGNSYASDCERIQAGEAKNSAGAVRELRSSLPADAWR